MKIRLNRPNKNLKAFTLIELMTVLAIISILGVTTLGNNYGSMKASDNLLNDTEAISIDIRDLQNRTSSFVKSDQVDNIGYGIFFDLNNNLKTESFFKNNCNDLCSNDIPSTSIIKPIDDFVLSVDDSIKRICINGCSDGKELTHDDNGNNAKLAIYFKKPRPYAYFSFSEDGLNYVSTVNSKNINHACIEIYNSKLRQSRHVDVYYIGQVAFSVGECSD